MWSFIWLCLWWVLETFLTWFWVSKGGKNASIPPHTFPTSLPDLVAGLNTTAKHSNTHFVKTHYSVQSQRQDVYEAQRRNAGAGPLHVCPVGSVAVRQQGRGHKAGIFTFTDHTVSMFHKELPLFFQYITNRNNEISRQLEKLLLVILIHSVDITVRGLCFSSAVLP